MTMTKITTTTTKSTALPCRRVMLLVVVVLTWTAMVMAPTASASSATASLPSSRFRGGSRHVAAAAAAATTTATLLHQHQYRQLMEEREDDDDDDHDDDDDAPQVEATAFPTAGPTAQTTMAPTVSTTTAPTTTATAAATTSPTTSPTSEQLPVTLDLLPFALTVVDQQQPHDEPQLRQDLQEYLFEFMDEHLQQQNVITGSSVRLLGIELQLDQGNGVEDDGGRARRLRLRLRRRRRRKLQDDEAEAAVFQDQDESNTDTAATAAMEWTYRGVAVLAPSSTTLAAAFNLDFATTAQIQQAQISALEDDNALQTYFLDQYREAVEAGLNREEGEEDRGPVLFAQVQVDDRAPIALDPETALQELEQQAQEGENDGTEQEDPEEKNNAPQGPNDNAIQDNGGDGTDNNGKGWLVGVIVGALLIVAGLIGTFFFVRKGRHQRKKSSMPDKLEVISEAGSDDGVEAIYNKTKGIPAVGTQSTDDDDASENPTGSPVSTSKQANEEEDGMEDGDPKRRLFFSWGGRGKKKENISLYAGSSIDHILDDFEGGTEIVPSRKERATSPVIDLTRPSENSVVRSFSNGWGGWTQQAETPKPAGTVVGSAAANALRKLSSYGRERTPPISNRDVKELDGMVANVQNLTSYDDEESMAGYSLASEDSKPKYRTTAQHKNTSGNSHEDTTNENEGDAASVASSEASGVQLNPLFAGVQNLLQNPERSQSNAASQNRLNFGILNRLRKKQQTQHFVSSDSESSASELNKSYATEGALEVVASPDQTRIFVDGEAGEVPVFTNHLTEDDAASLLTKDDDSIYKEDDSVKGGESLSGYSASQVSDSDNVIFDTTKIGGPSPLSTLGYFQRGDDANDGMLFPDITPAPSEEMEDILDITRNPMYTKSILDRGVATGDSDDEHSNAPSDELGFGPSTKLASAVNTTSSTLDISFDSDPAVVDYLMKERRSTRRFARKKREDRRQPPVTMEV